MKSDILRDMTRDELVNKQNEVEEEMFNLILKKRTKQLDNPLRIRFLRRDRARIITILDEDKKGLRQLAQSGELLPGKDKE